MSLPAPTPRVTGELDGTELDGTERAVRARYVVGATAPAARVRADLGLPFTGQQAMHTWVVLDALAVTDFPDIRTRCCR